MITFFRKIRKGLLGEGTASKYLIYAIGEIALVVIGILLALQVNKWNNSNLDMKSEKDYMERLVLDLAQDSILIQQNLERAEIKIEAFNRLEAILDGINNADISFYEHILPITLMGWRMPENRSRATFDEMVSSGHLKLIRDTKLREDIGLYYQHWKHHYIRINGRKSLLSPLVYKLIPIEYGEKNLTVTDFIEILKNQDKTQEFKLESQHERNYAHFVIDVFKTTLEKERFALKDYLVEAVNKQY